MSILRQIRSSVTLGVLWGLGWSVAGVGIAVYRVLFASPHLVGAMRLLPRFMLSGGTVFGLCGGAAGMAFAGMLVRAGRRQTLDELTTRSVGLWGAIAGIVLPGSVMLISAASGAPIIRALPFLAVAASVAVGVGALSAVATLKLARRAPLVAGPSRVEALP